MDWSDQVTFLIPTAPHASVPSTEMIEEVIASIRHYFPTSVIHLMADGCADYLAAISRRADNYHEYLNRCQTLCDYKWGNVRLQMFVKRTQQAEMTRRTLPEVTTPYVFFVEHDTPLRTDREWHWETLFKVLADGHANMIRLGYWEEGIHEAHEHLVRSRFEMDGITFARTMQYSQWPNIAKTEFYRKMLSEKIPHGLVTMIEIYLYGPALEDPDYYNIVMYCPDGQGGTTNQRFHHRNGRKDDPCDW